MNRDSRLPWLRLITFTISGLAFLLPVWWIAVTAVRPEGETFRYLSLSVWTFLPRNPTFSSIITVWQGPFGGALVNTAIVALATVVVGLVVCAPAAFALAVMEFRGRGVIFSLMVVTFLVPFDSIAVPLSHLMRSANLQNTYASLILPAIGNGLVVFLLRQFFLGVPRELREAAALDGLGWFGIFVRIYLPLSTNALISAAIILFIGQWQAYLWPLLAAPAAQMKVVAVAIAELASMYTIRYEQIFSAAFLTSLIPMLVLWFAQRFFRASFATTGIKE